MFSLRRSKRLIRSSFFVIASRSHVNFSSACAVTFARVSGLGIITRFICKTTELVQISPRKTTELVQISLRKTTELVQIIKIFLD